MSQWETLSYKENDETKSISRFTSGDKPESEKILVDSKGTTFDQHTCWLSHDVVDAYMLRVSDTTDTGTISHIFTDKVWQVMRHENSLWTYTVNRGSSYEWHEDILEKLPDWVEVGGNCSGRMD